MAGTNNMLPFCPTDTGTNLLTQGEYAVATDRTNGNQPGVASSKLVNKAIRQSSFVVSQIAQYLANKLNQNVLDDGDTAALQALMVSAFSPNSGTEIENLTFTTSVGSSALTIAVKNASNVDCSATQPAFVSFRSATLTSGLFNRRTITGALSMTVSSGSTLGQTSGQPSNIWVYLIDNAGTIELAVSHAKYQEAALVTTTAEGGAGAADSATAIYSTTARSNVPIRLIGYILNTQTTAGTWASAGTQIQLLPSQGKTYPTQTRYTSGSGTYNVPAGCTRIRVRMIGGGGGGAGSGTGASTGMTAGGNTTFGTTFLTANGGSAGTTNGYGGAGGTGSVGAGAIGFAQTGGQGGSPSSNTTAISGSGGFGAASPFGGGGTNGGGSNPISGVAAAANSGAGGGGGGGGTTNATFGGSGGGAGCFIDAEVNCSLSGWASSYSYAVGAAGSGGAAAGGAAGTAGGNGGSGVIVIDEYYD